jgi:enoyl-CoA hydratase/carnithine racemase
MNDRILLVRDGSIATVMLNRPELMNALDLAAWRGLAETFGRLDPDDEIRCVVVRGAGDEAFAAGADIAAFERERTAENARAYGQAEMAGILAVAHCRHPTVALIQGACVGGGLEIASACDLRIAGRSSRFGVPINRLGLTMAYDELEFFIGVVGRTVALELLLEGTVFGSERALRLGLVSRVVDDEKVEGEAYAAARRIAERAPLVNRWHKKFARRLADPSPLTPEEIAEGYAAFETEDYGHGYRAFLEKENPEFKGR